MEIQLLSGLLSSWSLQVLSHLTPGFSANSQQLSTLLFQGPWLSLAHPGSHFGRSPSFYLINILVRVSTGPATVGITVLYHPALCATKLDSATFLGLGQGSAVHSGFLASHPFPTQLHPSNHNKLLTNLTKLVSVLT